MSLTALFKVPWIQSLTIRCNNCYITCVMPPVEWLLLLPQLPPSSSSLRVAVWRRMRAAGSLSIQNGAWLLPASARSEQAVSETLEYVKSHGGSGLIFRSRFADPEAEAATAAAFRSNSGQEYAEFSERCQGLLGEIERESRQQKFTFAELDENEEELQKLVSWLRKIRARDFFPAETAEQAATSLEACRLALREFESQVYRREGLETANPTGDRSA